MRRVMLAAVGALLALLAPAVAAAQPPVPSTVGQLLARFGVSNVPVDFLVVVDTSGSMSFGVNHPYPYVQRAYDRFVRVLPANDHLSVITFDTAPALRFDGPLTSAADRQQALSVLPPTATGAYTDIGSALNTTLTQLERPEANPVEIVLFMTDGIDDPGPGSPYPTTSGPAWQALAARAARLQLGHQLVVFGAGLQNGGATNVGLLRQVFPNADIVSLPADQLPGFFQQAIDSARVAVLRPLVTAELGGGQVETFVRPLDPLSRTVRLRVTLRSAYAHLPVRVTVSGVSVTDARTGRPVSAVLSGGPVTLLLPPGGSRQLTVTAHPPVPAGGGIGTQRQADSLTVRLIAHSTVLPDQLLRQLFELRTNGHVTQPSGAVAVSRTTGLSYIRLAEYFAALLALAAALLLAYRRFVRLPDLVGGVGASGVGFVRLRGKRMTLPAPRQELPFTDGAKVEFFTRRGRPARVFVRAAAPPVQVKTRGWEHTLKGEHLLKFPDRLTVGRLKLVYYPRASAWQDGRETERDLVE